MRISFAVPLAALISTGIPTTAQSTATIHTLDGRALPPASIDKTVTDAMVSNQVPGLGVAIIENGRVVYAKAYGMRDREKALPMTVDTVMYGASLTKATFAWMVMQLVDEGKVDLDRSIGDYLPKPLPDYEKYADLAGDERWRKLTFRILLSHCTGFANFRSLEPDGKLRFHRDPGARYGYSGEGINLAQFVLENGLGLDVGKELQRRVFDRFAMTRTAMTWSAAFADNLGQSYADDGALLGHKMRGSVRAAGSMDTTIADWSRFLAAVARGDGLSAKARREMVRRQTLIDSPFQFPTLTEERTDKWRAIELGYGLGWGLFKSPYGDAFFKEGHDDGTSNYALVVDARRNGIVMMANSNRAEMLFVSLVDALLGPVHLPVAWEGWKVAPQK